MNDSMFLLGDGERKQHLNLSEFAFMTMNEDRRDFDAGRSTINGFMNRIFINYYPRAKANITAQLDKLDDELQYFFAADVFDDISDKEIADLKKRWKSAMAKQLAKETKFEKGKCFNFNWNNKSAEIFEDEKPGGNANYYDGNVGLFAKAVFEQYAREPRYIREQIFYADFLQEIDKAINAGVKLKIKQLPKWDVKETSRRAKEFQITPYKIVQDKAMMYNYILCYSEMAYTDSEGNRNYTEKRPTCMRLAYIDKMRVELCRGFISEAKKKALDKEFLEKGAMYMASDAVPVTVRFTKKGLDSYRNQIYMRPALEMGLQQIDPESPMTLTFICPEVQALNYFFKFGREIEILEPESLRQKFIERYKSALKNYEV